MIHVTFRFYAELNEFLPGHRRQVPFDVTVDDGMAVGAAVGSLGIPQGRIDLLLVNGASVGLHHSLREGDRVSVYPVLDANDVTPLTRIQDRPRRRLEFVLDVHLGKLAHQLRLLGFDTLYRNDSTADDLCRIAVAENRILLSRSRALVSRPGLVAAYCVKSADTREQLIEVLERFDLWRAIGLFRRCLHCNTPVLAIDKAAVLDRLPPKVVEGYKEFTTCPTCGRVYWQGTHCDRMKEYLRKIFVERGKAG